MDPVECQIRLDWALEAQEAAETLNASLKEHIEALVSEVGDLRSRMTTLKDVQESLLSEKLAAEASLELLLREKAELSGENASLRAHARDMARSLAAYVAADALLAAATPPAAAAAAAAPPPAAAAAAVPSGSPARGPPPSPLPSSAAAAAAPAPPAACTAACAELGARLSSARYLVVRLLELARGAGLLQSSSGVDLWGHLGRGMPASAREPLRGGLVMALAEAVGVAGEMRAVAPGLPPADPLPSLLSDFQRGLEGGGGGSREGSPRGGAGEGSGGGGSEGAGSEASGQQRGLLGSFLDLLVGDVEGEREALEEQERAAAECTAEQRAAALKLEQIRAAIAQGVEMEEQLEQRKAQLLQP